MVVALVLTQRAASAAALSEVICTGDCNYDHVTEINELVTGVNIALEQASIDRCPGFDLTRDGKVEINELVDGVRNSLNGCPAARLERTACDFTLPIGQDPAKVACGSVIVQEDRSRSDGRTVRVPFAVFRAMGPDPAPDPFVYLSGGPGGPTLERIGVNLPNVFAPFLSRRDLVFFDQRGTGESAPSLDCPEWREAYSTYLAKAQDIDEDAAVLMTAMHTCHDRLLSEGVNFGAYTSSASAHDLEDLLLALGYQSWNLYGISYGTRLGQTALRDTPEHIRSIGLDSNVPVSENQDANWAADFERSLNTLFDGCAKDAACNAAFPNLEQTFFDLVAKLNANPVTLHPTNPNTGERFTTVATGDRLLLGIQQALYDTPLIPFLPLVITATASGRYSLLTTAGAQIALPSPIAWGMYYSIECNEEVPFITPAIVAAATAGVPEEIKKVGLTFWTQFTLDTCAFWDTAAPPASENQPVVSDIPALVFAGEYDPITPPAYSQLVAHNLSHSFFFEFPGTGHGVLVDRQECAANIALQFLANPTQPPDSSCVAAIPPPHFVGAP